MGGKPFLIASAGYVGSAFFSGILRLLSVRDKWASVVFGGLALLFGVITVWFVRNLFGLVFGLGTAAAFAFLYWKPLAGAHYIVDFLAVTSSLYALYDLTDFLWVGTRTDAVILAEITSVPEFIWAGPPSVTSHFVGFCSILLSRTAVPGTVTLSGGVTSCFREAVKPPIEDPSRPISLRSASMIGAWAL